jgi:hypothetical protein
MKRFYHPATFIRLSKNWISRNTPGIGILLILLLLSSCAVKRPFNLVLLPDTQTYSALYPEIFRAQTEWIVKNADSITFVLHQGDITDNNTEKQWENAVAALFLMDGKVPYTFVPGNHDTGDPGKNANNRELEFFNQYLPYEKYSKMEGFGGAFEPGRMENTWYTFKAGGYKWLILSLEFGPRNKVLKWAGEVIQSHPRHKVIINTHAYMYSDGTRMSITRNHAWLPQHYGVGKLTGDDAVNDAEMMWEKLVSQYPHVLLVFSGHVLHSGTARLESEGIHGNKVYQMLANYQGGVEGSEKGGNGFLRIVTINPKQEKISVRSYSPYTGQYKTEPDHQFTFENVKF